MNRPVVKFAKELDKDFVSVLKSRVRNYFEENNISRFGNGPMYFKTVFMVSLYFVPFLFMLLLPVSVVWQAILLFALMGLGKAGIGLSVMHDANHGAYSNNKTINKLLGMLLDLVGGSALTWKVQHNVLHHSFTNIDGMDEDIAPPKLLRFSPHQKRYPIHRLQHFYAWFFYGLMTFAWITVKDFRQLIKYHQMGLTKAQKKSLTRMVIELLIGKVVYYAYALVLPMVVLPVAWYYVLLGFGLMHFIAGLLLAAIFQPAHVMPTTEYPLPNEDGKIENNWAIHQLLTTTNFAPGSRLFSWFVGGLNYQIEHHLFPTICHIHYKKISKIVEETAKEYGLPYHTQKTFAGAIRQHTIMLRDLGRYDFEGMPAIH
ncbi:MAG: acyl-CoA desaturase [Bacteroidetes bacterium]|nr:MAG: acyl-CoA desaturase [Bacteroidota bacterium]